MLVTCPVSNRHLFTAVSISLVMLAQQTTRNFNEYANTDGLWPMFYQSDKSNQVTLISSCFKQSSRYRSSSWLSCCWKPLKRGALQSTETVHQFKFTLGQFRSALKTHLFSHWQLQRRVTVFLVRCVQIRLLTYLLSNSDTQLQWFCLRAPRYRLTLWCTLGLLVDGAIQVPQLQLQTVYYTTTNSKDCPTLHVNDGTVSVLNP